MLRWISVCLLLSVTAIASVWLVAPKTIADAPKKPDEPAPLPRPPEAQPQAAPAAEPFAAPRAEPPVGSVAPSLRLELVEYQKVNKDQPLTEPIVIPNAALVIDRQQEVSTEKEGVISFIGTDVQPGETVPEDKKLPDAELGFLAVPVGAHEDIPESEKFRFEGNPTWYRRAKETDQLEPGKVVLSREIRQVRKLKYGDWVKRGQLLALINPRKSFDDVSIKVEKLKGADKDRLASQKQKEEYYRRYQSMMDQNRKVPGSVSKDDYMAADLQSKKFGFEEALKAAEVASKQRELNAALTDLRMHEVRAAIDGKVRQIYKNHQGEAVKAYELVLQLQNPDWLRVEGLLEVQEALKLKEGMEVTVEASRPDDPRLIIRGHLNTVNCVAVSKGKRPVIVSGSEDETLRGWDSASGARLWMLRGLKSAVRAAACSPPNAKRNLVLFGCADGTVRLLDLDNAHSDAKPQEMNERHQQAINGVAFSPDGETCATCGEDRSICLWKTETGELLHRLTAAHRGPVTSVQFASANRLVSAGQDKHLIVWDVEGGRPPVRIPPNFEGRGGEVAQLGVSPDGRVVLFDQGKELRLQSLADKQIEGTLQNPSDSMNFSTMALFSPDGKTILTNGSAPGKLQLWRTPTAQGRGSELRQFIWTKGTATCGAFAPEDGSFAVTGTQDHQVLVWTMPEKKEAESRLSAHLILVEKHLDTQSRQVRVWAELKNPGWLIPGMRATMVVPPQQGK
jgi:WD40 repeat protein